MVSTVYSRTLLKAAQLAGGSQKLARHLRVPLADLQKWLGGSDAPPIAVFLKAVDLVLDETSPSGGSDPGDPPPGKDCAADGGSASAY